ncbi:NUDIX hydrolase domain-like protein [Copromyces sp. CBS 386.78]|nr:NUDIX hydrolase domain-like protein [Copromyces sp. CBS 386.78]
MRNILTRYRYPARSSLASASASASRTRALAAASNTKNLFTTATTTTKLITPNAKKRTFLKMTVPKTQEPTITSITELTPQSSKWLTLQQISYVDQTGKSRLWEVAARKTRFAPTSFPSSPSGAAGATGGGIDAVAMCNILLHPSRPPSTLLVIQYRPPLDAYTIEWPAGLIDKGETPEQAAVREFKEETGYECVVKRVSPVQAADPGMSSANMVMATVEVNLTQEDGEGEGEGEGGEIKLPEQRLEDGEHITRVVVPVKDLYRRLVEYSRMERHVVSAKLFHFAEGMEFARMDRYGVFACGGGGERE